jgi:hypothetical protein
MRPRVILALGAGTAVVVVAVIGLGGYYRREVVRRKDSDALARLDTYCTRVRQALEIDADDLESGGLPRQQAATALLDEKHALHSPDDVQLCAPVVPENFRLTECWVTENYACLAHDVRRALAMIATRTNGGDPTALQRLHERCSIVAQSVSRIARDLDNEEPAARKVARDKSLRELSYPSKAEIDLCVGEEPDLGEYDRCFVNENYACLARLERRVEAALYIPGNDPR